LFLDSFAQEMYRITLRKSSSKMELTKRISAIQNSRRLKRKRKSLSTASFLHIRFLFVLCDKEGHCPKGQWPLGHSTAMTSSTCKKVQMNAAFFDLSNKNYFL